MGVGQIAVQWCKFYLSDRSVLMMIRSLTLVTLLAPYYYFNIWIGFSILKSGIL